jgi:hypothetical protein
MWTIMANTPENRLRLIGPGLRAVFVASSLGLPAFAEADGPNDQTPRAPSLALGGLITVGPNVLVSASRANHSHFEVVIAAHPSDPTQLMAGSMRQRGKNDLGVVGYRSSDGGRTWEFAFENPKPRAFTKPAKLHLWSDPAIAYGPDGSLYYATIYTVSTANEPSQLVIVRSLNRGKTWEAGKVAADFLDRPFLAVDCTDGKFRGHVYCHFEGQARDTLKLGLAVSLSRDAGKTFGPLREFWIAEANSTWFMMMPGPGVVLSDGTLVVPYGHRRSFREETSEICVWCLNSGGDSPLDKHTVITTGVRRGYPWNVIPTLAADPISRSYKDRLYLTWPQGTPDGQRILLAVSNDKGLTWSRPTVLSDESGGKTYDAVLPAVAVNKKGVVGVSWYDSRPGEDGKPCMKVRFQASVDGGNSWLPSVCVTEVPSQISFKVSTPLNERPDDHLGDTAGLAADAAGDFHPIWVDKRSGVLQIYTARVSIRDAGGGK